MQLEMVSLRRLTRFVLIGFSGIVGLSPASADDLSDFKSPLDNSPMTFQLQTGEVETPAVKNFKATGVNEYRNNADAIAEGKTLYAANCIVAMEQMAQERWAQLLSVKILSTLRHRPTPACSRSYMAVQAVRCSHSFAV